MKKKIGLLNALYPTPAVLVGTEVDSKINYTLVAHIGIIDHNTMSLSMNKSHYSNIGIKENRNLSINIINEEMIVKADYMGMISGLKNDKSDIFESFNGEIKGAPMIKDSLLNMECEVVEILDRTTHDIFIVKPVNTYCDESCLTNGKPDISKIKPILFDMPQKKYWSLGESIADCWNIGKSYRSNI